jgi:hypothetical protein
VYFVPYRDKKVVGVFVRFSCAASTGEIYTGKTRKVAKLDGLEKV